MTRAEIEQAYKVENGVIRSPGKFEGEAVYVPYFWDVYLDGGADEDDGEVLVFYVSDEDRATFPELQGPTVMLRQLDNGFVVEV